MDRTIFLIGMMCSGKSTVGRSLAALLGMPFIDLDRVAEAQVGPLLPYIQREGEGAFRALESEVLARVAAGAPAVVATGGGTPTVPENLRIMLQAGTVVWIDVTMEALMPRIIRAGGDRPLLFGLQGEALRERVQGLLRDRSPAYASAHVRVLGDAPPAEVAQAIRAGLPDQPR